MNDAERLDNWWNELDTTEGAAVSENSELDALIAVHAAFGPSGITPEQSTQWGRADWYARITKRAEAAEAAAREQAEMNIHNINLCTEAIKQRDEWRQRAEAAEAKLAAVPVDALRRVLFTGYRTDTQITADADAINNWLQPRE